MIRSKDSEPVPAKEPAPAMTEAADGEVKEAEEPAAVEAKEEAAGEDAAAEATVEAGGDAAAEESVEAKEA